MRIVTSGHRYLDIDAYAGCIAKAELLNLQGIKAIAASTAPLNESVPPSVQRHDVPLVRDYSPATDDQYVMVDISEPDYFDKFVQRGNVIEVIDHHPGTESHWSDKPEVAVHIENIGAACTQVYEQWEASSLTEQMQPVTAKLLAYGILDNTLNFGAKITTDRDRAAYEHLLRIAAVSDVLAEKYFRECEQSMLTDMPKAVVNDMKEPHFKSFGLDPIAFGQLAVWNAQDVLDTSYTEIKNTLANTNPDWFMNLIGIRDSASYFVSDNPRVQSWLSNLLSVSFNGNVSQADRLWLRKEVIKHETEAK